MKDWQKRVLAEKEDLDEKIGKLSGALLKGMPAGADPEEWNMLHEHLTHMERYSAVLGRRISGWPVNAEQEQQPEPIIRFFAYAHLPEHLRAVSKPFSRQADHILTLPRSAERTVALRKLLESKDAAVRAALPE